MCVGKETLQADESLLYVESFQDNGLVLEAFLFLPLPAGPRCHVSWEKVQLLGLTTDQLLKRCLRFPELHVDT